VGGPMRVLYLYEKLHVPPTICRRDAIPTRRFLYGLRLIGALLIATLVPLLIDLRARRSSRTRQ